jgi:hypothetical protein
MIGRRPTSWIVMLFLGLLVGGCGPSVTSEEAMEYCRTAVAQWANVDVSRVTGDDISDQNPSGEAWDFRGTYPGGDWACGGPAGEREASQIMTYADDGTVTSINEP